MVHRQTRTTPDGGKMSNWRATNQHGNRSFIWYCPGCDIYHAVPIDGPKKWGFNEDWESPTLTPSVLVNEDASGVQDADRMLGWIQHRCHVFIREGRIKFLGDCTHDMAGRTVDLPTGDPEDV